MPVTATAVATAAWVFAWPACADGLGGHAPAGFTRHLREFL
jgi:hypothetical protein